jgi:hypothetical protein
VKGGVAGPALPGTPIFLGLRHVRLANRRGEFGAAAEHSRRRQLFQLAGRDRRHPLKMNTGNIASGRFNLYGIKRPS